MLMYQSSFGSAGTGLSLLLLPIFPFMPSHDDVVSANHVTSFLIYLRFFFFQMAFWGLKSFVRWPFPCKGIHVFCCILESIREQCLEQDRVSSWTDTGLIMPFVTTDIPVLQATRWCGHWYAVTHSEDLFCINMLAYCTKIKQLVSACRSF